MDYEKMKKQIKSTFDEVSNKYDENQFFALSAQKNGGNGSINRKHEIIGCIYRHRGSCHRSSEKKSNKPVLSVETPYIIAGLKTAPTIETPFGKIVTVICADLSY